MSQLGPPKPLLALHSSTEDGGGNGSIVLQDQDHQSPKRVSLLEGDQDHKIIISPPPLPPPPPFINKKYSASSSLSSSVNKYKYKYMECLKNHAAAIGGNATDGCGEFMPGGEDGSLEALKCSACNCHRNFHRKIHIHHPPDNADNEPPNSGMMMMMRRRSSSTSVYGGGSADDIQLGLAIGHHHHNHQLAAAATPDHHHEGEVVMMKKRFRTKFSQEQKEKMHEFAEKAGWKIQKLDDSEVRRFCQEIGIKRKVLKVWMHNNKYHLSKKTNNTTPSTTT